jgi:HSP20 family protein
MAMIRWIPSRDALGLRREMDRMWEDFFGRSDRETTGLTWTPDVDISETKDEYHVVVEAPGMSKDDIKISLQENVLTIKGEKRQEEVKEGTNYHRTERIWGAFQRSFTLPTAVQTGKVNAVYKDGVLAIALPKAEEARAKEIDVKVE